MDGLAAEVFYQPSDAAQGSSTEWKLVYTGIEGLEVGYAGGDNEDSLTNTIENTNLWAKYTLDSFTFGYQANEEDEELSGDELSEALKLQLNRLQAMRDAGKKLFDLERLYISRFPKGIISKEVKIIHIEDNTTLNDLLFSYSNVVRSKSLLNYEPPVSSRVHAGDGQLIAEFAVQKRLFVPFETIVPFLFKIQ